MNILNELFTNDKSRFSSYNKGSKLQAGFVSKNKSCEYFCGYGFSDYNYANENMVETLLESTYNICTGYDRPPICKREKDETKK